MSNANKYLGPHVKTGPNSYEIGPVSVKAARLSPGIEGFFSGAWGLNEGPHRGTSQKSVKLNPLTPFIWDDLMQESSINSSHIDSEYTEIFNQLFATTIGELDIAKRLSSANLHPSSIEKAKAEQRAVFSLIQTKSKEYEAQKASAYSLYGHNPFFLMKELSFRKIFESVHTSPPDASVAYTAIDTAYRSALNLKRISLQMNILNKQLGHLANSRHQAEKEHSLAITTSIADEHFSIINDEININFDILPQFLRDKITAAGGSTIGATLAQSLMSYKAIINGIIASEQAATGSYSIANPSIKSPLSTPELEALNNLVDLQANTNLGRRWQDYHSSLLHSEIVRHLTETNHAFSGLIDRSLEVERQQEQARIESERRQEQLRIEIEQMRLAAEQEAQRHVAVEEKADQVGVEIKPQEITLTSTNGDLSNAKPLVITADGLVEGYDLLSTPWSSLESQKLEIAAKAMSRLAGLFAAALYSPSLGNGELQRTPVVLSMPLSHLTGGVTNESDLRALDSVSLPFRVTSKLIGEHTQLYLSPTGNALSDKVRVRETKLDPSTNLYTFTTEGYSPRTLTWTPNNAPGHDALGSTELPADRPDIKIYPGSRVTPVEGRTDEHPAHDDDATDDYVLWFPKESGIDPVYIMASRSGPRYEPGTATGTGQPAEGNWLGNALAGGAAIPSQVADQLRGQNFKNFDEFRERLWRTVSIDSKLSEQLNPLNRSIAQKGYSPYAPRTEQVGGREKLEIHHITPISEGGEVYNIDNMVIMTPKAHIAEHSKNSGKPL